jgi:hypothetical protein
MGERMNDSETLYINLNDSRCGNCDGSVHPNRMTCDILLGYNMDINGTPGCGKRWTKVSSDYFGMDDAVTDMRPDLEFIGVDKQ